MKESYYCVLLAGGIGSRFWPYSRRHQPKQFLDFFGRGESLLQMTFRRFRAEFAPDHIFVVTNTRYKEIVQTQLPELPEQNILLEVNARNTAAAIAYATLRIRSIDPTSTVVYAPSDHMILKEELFRLCIKMSLDRAQQEQCLVTLGIRPSYPEIGYGYIQAASDGYNNLYEELEVMDFHPVKTFIEKPTLEMCRVLIDSGEFFWNSGIFVANISFIMEAFAKHLPELSERLYAKETVFGTPDEQAYVDQVYPYLPNISFDYGVMEKLSNVQMLLCEFGWADLGSWGAIYNNSAKDEERNVVLSGGPTVFNNSRTNLVVLDDPSMLVVMEGVEDLILVKKENVLMICKRGEEQKLKQMMLAAASIDEKYVD